MNFLKELFVGFFDLVDEYFGDSLEFLGFVYTWTILFPLALFGGVWLVLAVLGWLVK